MKTVAQFCGAGDLVPVCITRTVYEAFAFLHCTYEAALDI